MEPFSGTLKNSDCRAFGLFETVPRNLILSVQLQSVDNGAICSLKAKLIFDISKQILTSLKEPFGGNSVKRSGYQTLRLF